MKMAISAPVEDRLVRCAIYTRISTDKALDAPVSSLTAQREVCQAYIRCQAHRNWVELPYRYDDGGFTGGKLLMPRSRLIAQLDDELLQARESLRFWRDQMLLLDETELQVAVKRQVMHREAEIRRLLETQEILLENGRV